MCTHSRYHGYHTHRSRWRKQKGLSRLVGFPNRASEIDPQPASVLERQLHAARLTTNHPTVTIQAAILALVPRALSRSVPWKTEVSISCDNDAMQFAGCLSNGRLCLHLVPWTVDAVRGMDALYTGIPTYISRIGLIFSAQLEDPRGPPPRIPVKLYCLG